MDDVLALLETSYFRAGLRLGIVALAVGWALRFATGRYRPPLPIAGLLIAAATMGALYLTGETLGSGLLAMGAIALGVLVVRIARAPAWAQILAAAPGAAWLAMSAPVIEQGWVRVLIAVLVPLGGFLINDFETRHQRLGLGVVAYTLAALGAFAAVPDTEQALVLIAVAVPVTLLSWPKVAVSLGMEGAFLAVGALLWVTAAGGEGRPPSIVGSAACLGFLLLEPALVRLRPRLAGLGDRVRQTWLGAVAASLPQFLLVVICSRVAARFETMAPALVVVAAVYVAAAGTGFYLASRLPDGMSEAVPSHPAV